MSVYTAERPRTPFDTQRLKAAVTRDVWKIIELES